jgi:hypothetical protein
VWASGSSRRMALICFIPATRPAGRRARRTPISRVNRSNASCAYLIFGTRMAYDTVHYPDVGKILYDEAGTWRLHRTDDGSLIREGTIEQFRPLTRWDPDANQVP